MNKIENTKTKSSKTAESSRLETFVSLREYWCIRIANNPGYYEEKYFIDWYEKPFTCVGVKDGGEETLLPKNFKRRCDASRWARKHGAREIQQWYF